MEEPIILPNGTICFFDGELYLICRLIIVNKSTKQPLYVLEGKRGNRAIVYQDELTLPEDMDNASIYKGVLQE